MPLSTFVVVSVKPWQKESHKENIFEISYATADQQIDKIIPHDFSIIESSRANGLTKTKIIIPASASPNELLKWAIRKFEVHGFTEILPSMNDIFISQVNQKRKGNGNYPGV